MSQLNSVTPEHNLLRGRPVSEVFREFVEPLLLDYCKRESSPGLRKLNEVCKVPWIIWNTVVLEDFYSDEKKFGGVREVKRLLKGQQEGIDFVETYVKRKRELFGEFRYLFGTCEFYKTPEGKVRCRAEAKLPATPSRMTPMSHRIAPKLGGTE